MSTQQVALGNTSNNVTGDQHNYNYNIRVESGSSSGQAPTPIRFNDTPVDLLSVYFTGREKELDEIKKILDVVHEDIPTRCVVYGMHGIGKTQLALRFAKRSFDQLQYSHIFWMSATTVEKLNQGFADLLTLVVHPDRPNLGDQRARLKAARRWLEDAISINWLLVLDNVDATVLSFLQEHLPRKNQQGKILLTTRTADVATVLARTAGKQHHAMELGLPKIEDATRLLFVESNTDVTTATTLIKSKADDVVKFVGQLPLAISHTASFMKQTGKSLDELLLLFHSEHRTHVRFDPRSVCIIPSLTHCDSSSAGRTPCRHTRRSPLVQRLPPNSITWNTSLRTRAIY
jgi:NB-ARC domain